MLKVYNRRRPNEIPKGSVYIGRPSTWGNPFSKGSKDQNIADFRKYAVDKLKREPNWLNPLKGKHLICWCSPQGCHGDVLIELANPKQETDELGLGLKVVVTGGRNFTNKQTVFDALDQLDANEGIAELIHGGARGADTLSGLWAEWCSVKTSVFLPDWNRFGKRAGILRNQTMLDQKPNVVIAFPGGRGTAHMVNASKQQGFQVIDAESYLLDAWAEENCPEDVYLDKPSEWELRNIFV